MKAADFVKEYRSKTDDELLALWQNQTQLMPEASTCLAEEMARRQIGEFQLSSPFSEQPAPGTATDLTGGMPHAVGTAAAPYPITPSSIDGTSKRPWTPNTVGTISFFFGPFAGALLSSLSLRRMGYPEKAKKALLFGVLGVVGFAVILFFIPDSLARLVGLIGEVAFGAAFRRFEEQEFAQWRNANRGAEPAGGWKAVGWGLIGTFLFFVIGFVVFFVLIAFLEPV